MRSKASILTDSRLDFLRDTVANIPDVQYEEEGESSGSVSTTLGQPMPGPAGSPMGNSMSTGSPLPQQRPSLPMSPLGSMGSAPVPSGRGRGR